MDAGLDNANNPFAISNGAATDNIMSQKSDGLLLNLTDNFKQNGAELSPTTDYYEKEKSNGKRSASEFDDEDDDDFGPETDVDALSPLETTKGFGDAFANNNPFDEGVYNPYVEHQEKAALEMERNLQKQDSGEFEEPRMGREETPTPPADAVHDVRGLEENAAESDSEDEWNYIKGDEANKENISPVPDKKVAEVSEEDDNMSQLNPNAAEFVPVSPTRNVPSPACRVLINDQVISQSPKRPVNELDINLPNPSDFEKEVKSRPSEVESYSNGHNGDSDRNTPTDLMEDILNGRNIDEIPEFQPGSTPKKVLPSDEFHFGPNAAPFTPVRLLDQSEAALSTKAIYGDESIATLGTSFNESVATEDAVNDLNTLNKESDPMSMSFYAEKGDSNPFDLNEVQILPENLEEFLKQPDNEPFNETISDLPEHHPLGEPEHANGPTLNNDDALQITDLDKQSYDDEKELASPLEPENDASEFEKDLSEKESLMGVEETDFSKTPEPTHENLLEAEFCHVPKSPLRDMPSDVEVISPRPSPELISPDPRESSADALHSTEDLSSLGSPVMRNLPPDVELLSPETMERLSHSPKPEDSEKDIASPIEKESFDLLESTEELDTLNQPQATEVDDLLGKSEAIEVNDLLKPTEAMEVNDLLKQTEVTEVNDLLKQNEATEEVNDMLGRLETGEVGDVEEVKQDSDLLKEPEESEVHNLLLQSEATRVDELPEQTKASEIDDFLEQTNETNEVHELLQQPEATENDDSSEVADIGLGNNLEEHELVEAVSEVPVSKSPEAEVNVLELQEPIIPVCEPPLPVSSDPQITDPEVHESSTTVFEPLVSKSPEIEVDNHEVNESQIPVCEVPVSKSPAIELFESKSPICDVTESKSSVCDLSESKSPFPDEAVCGLQSDTGDLESPVSPDFTKPELIAQAQVHFEELCHPQEEIHVPGSPQEDIHLPESPQEDITSSVRDDDTHSPVPSPVHDVIEDSFVAVQSTICAVESQLISNVDQEQVEFISNLGHAEVSSPKSVDDMESVAKTDVNRDELESDVDPNQPLIPLPPQATSEEIEVETENIAPEFTETIIVTPSEESKQDEIPAVPSSGHLDAEPVSEDKPESKELVTEITAVGVVAGVATGAAIAAVASATKVEDKKKPTVSSAKKPTASKSATTTSKSTLKASPAPKTLTRLSASSPKVAPSKTGATKPIVAAASKPAASKPLTKPKTAPPKSAEKKPVANGDTKSTVKTTLSSKKIASDTTTARTLATTKSATTTSKTSPTKTAPRPAAAPRSTAVSKTTTLRPATATGSTAAKPRPTTLTSKPATGSPSPAKTTASTTRVTLTKTSPRTATAPPKPKSAVTSATALKPRVPLTKTVSKAPDTEKQNKESANKLTASRSSTTANKSIGSATAVSRTTTSSVRRVEKQVSATRTIQSKTTTTTMKSTTGKKPVEIIRNGSSKTKSTTKIEKPKEHGVSSVVTEEITVNDVSSTIDSEPQLVKDNSPIDNKLLNETTLIQTNTAD